MKKQLKMCLTAAALAAFAAPMLAAKVCDVRKYGAKGDGTTKDTKAIQAAIDDCAKQKKGGTVTLSGGTFLSAPIVLKSNITLNLGKDTTLLGSPDHDDYPVIQEFRQQGHQALVSAVHAEHVSITGEGTIDGNGASWWHVYREAGPPTIPGSGVARGQAARPRLVVFDHCKHVSLTGVTVKNSPFWQVVPYYSDDIVIRNVRITATLPSPNTDAIDPFSSSNLVIDHVYADTGDDDVAIKSGFANSPGGDEPSKNITITDCTFDHGHGVSLGSEIAGGVQNVRVERVKFTGTDNGIRIKANRDRGADVSNIVFKDITMDNVKNPILITEYYPSAGTLNPVAAMPVTRLTPMFHNITIENVTATNSGNDGSIVGLPESPVLDLTLRNVHISGKTGMLIAYAKVTMENTDFKAESGEPLRVAESATVTKK
ncbi:MAG TPA: glycoside hydrolase family 28 protein [Acidobacteriaceae bacterium]|nr:glycoside hydrolase family 28 protein [Acidobacteriaceae bacterium]